MRIAGTFGDTSNNLPLSVIKMFAVKASNSIRSILNFSMKEATRALSSAAALDLGGIFPPVALPFYEREDINFAALENNIVKWNEFPFRGFVVLGSNSEYTLLSPEEKVDVVEMFSGQKSEDKMVIAGSGCESTRDTIKLSQALADAGADALLVVTPCYYKSSMTGKALAEHYKKVADNSPVPIILYSVPAFTNIDIPVDTIISLARHPNIIGLKESSGNVAKIGQIVHQTKTENFQVLAGSASYILQSYIVGATGAVCALANILGEEVCRLYELCKSGDFAAATDLQHKLIIPNAAVTAKFGIAGLKFAMEKFGYVGGKPRSPLLPLSEEKQKLLIEDFKLDGFLD